MNTTKRIINIVAVNVHYASGWLNEDLEFTFDELNNDLTVENIHAVADKWMTENWGDHSSIKFGEIKIQQREIVEEV